MGKYYLQEVKLLAGYSHAGSDTKPLLVAGILEDRDLIVVQEQCLGACQTLSGSSIYLDKRPSWVATDIYIGILMLMLMSLMCSLVHKVFNACACVASEDQPLPCTLSLFYQDWTYFV